MLTRETFLFFLQKVTGQSYFRKNNGKIDFTNEPKWLPQAPQGWFENVLTFARNTHYWGLNRSFSNQYTFYKDGQDIIKSLIYQQTGIDDAVQLVVNKHNPNTDVYEPYFKGDIDVPHIVDNPLEGLKATIMEGGLQKLIKAYENTVFEIPCDGSIAENKQVRISGYMFKSILNYSIVPFTATNDQGVIIPIVLNNPNEYDYGILKGDQKYEAFDRNNYINNLKVNKNYSLSSVNNLTVTITGQLIVENNLTNGNVFLFTSFGNKKVDILPKGLIGAGLKDNINVSIDLLPGENLFLVATTEGGAISFSTSNLEMTYNSKQNDTFCYVIKPYDLLNLLLRKICEHARPINTKYYTLSSSLLKEYENITITSSMALRGADKAVVKTKLSDFFDAFYAVLTASMGVQYDENGNQQLFFERYGYVRDSSVVDMNVGEVYGLEIEQAQDKFIDTISVGYAEQKYDDRRGYMEYNTTLKFKAPFTPYNSSQKELKLISPYRADMFGIEDARKVSSGGTANNKSDNDIFFLNIDFSKTDNTEVIINSDVSSIKSLTNNPPLKQVSYTNIEGLGLGQQFQIGTLNSTNDIIRYLGNGLNVKTKINYSGTYRPGTYAYHTGLGFLGTWHDYAYPSIEIYVRLYKNNSIIDQVKLTLNDKQQFSYSFSDVINYSFGDYIHIDIVPVDITLPYLFRCFNATAKCSITMQSDNSSIYGLKRLDYINNHQGVDNIETAYNIEDLSPMLMLRSHGAMIRSIFWNYTGKSLTFLTSDKNHNLIRIVNGETITECTDVPISSLSNNLLWLPYYIKYKTKVPANFKQILDTTSNGHIQASFIGTKILGFTEEVKQKPAIDEAQEWKLLCSPKMSIDTLRNIEFNALNTIELMALGSYWSYLNPVKWYPFDLAKSAQYNFVHMDDDIQGVQTSNLTFPSQYIQKFQKNDTISLQCVTNGLSPVQIDIFDINTELIVDTFNLSQVSDPALSSPFILFEGSFALNDIPNGLYQLKASIGYGEAKTLWKSEPIAIAEEWPDTMIFKYSDTRNKWTTIFTTGFSPEFRIESKFGKYNTESKFTQFENQSADIETINGVPHRSFILNVGWRSNGVPPWARELLEFILLLETCQIDGISFTRSTDSKFEEEEIAGWPMSNWKIKVRPSVNKFGVSQTTDGTINDNMLVTYPIDTTLFGENNTNGQIVISDYQ